MIDVHTFENRHLLPDLNRGGQIVHSGDLRAAENDETFTAARAGGLRELEFATGVDTDQELQRLLVIEQNYAANAQVIRTADELIQLILGI